ncbi:hypothetical protein Acid345_1261 [Candidatus Koribacter versatilis Ellin345]|uniref:Uncharacterized protein n=1 Tax=Koribacter versatilis (strain Ellin345) TaxID=204669 RepID=Q1IS87_KORVE|nr:hypothetical protein [Candidatus Koribacter versatilis]ABF40263.1 hypothetical protein Acid345_1261 [Candidatus Koribacter versatilis Ellin345]
MNVRRCCATAVVLLFLLSGQSLLAQDSATQAPPPDSPSAAKQKHEKSDEQKKVEKQEQSQTILGVVPNYNTTTEKTAQPLSPGQKFHLFAKSTFSPFQFLAVGAQAGIGQAMDSYEDYGQGAEGYGKRYGAAFADQASSNFFGKFAYPVIFREDPRYYRMGEGTTSQRFWYSLGAEFVAHRDRGGKEFHFSNVLGAFTSAAISNAYYPDKDRTAGNTFERAGIALGYSCAGNIAAEFWPDVYKKWFQRAKKKKDSGNP